jgi:hypothetical protein
MFSLSNQSDEAQVLFAALGLHPALLSLLL